MKAFFLFLSLSFFLFQTFPNDGGYHYEMTSGNMIPVENEHIQMVRERVIYKNGQIRTSFLFRNTSLEPHECTFGFPVIGDINKAGQSIIGGMENEVLRLSEDERRFRVEEYYQFTCQVNGIEVERQLAPIEDPRIDDYQYAFVFSYSFKPLEEIWIHNRYNALPESDFTSMGTNRNIIEYVLVTGSLWKDRIEEAEIQFHIPLPYNAPDNISPTLSFPVFDFGLWRQFNLNYSQRPTEIRQEGEVLVLIWKFTDFEPVTNITCSWGVDLGNSSRISVSDLLSLLYLQINQFSAQEYYHHLRERGQYAHDDQNGEALRIDQIARAQTQRREIFIQSFSDRGAFDLYLKLLYSYIHQGYQDYIRDRGMNTKEELILLCRYYINGQYARQGYRFSSLPWQELYGDLPWYRGQTRELSLSEEENKKIEAISNIRHVLENQ